MAKHDHVPLLLTATPEDAERWLEMLDCNHPWHCRGECRCCSCQDGVCCQADREGDV